MQWMLCHSSNMNVTMMFKARTLGGSFETFQLPAHMDSEPSAWNRVHRLMTEGAAVLRSRSFDSIWEEDRNGLVEEH